MEKEEDKKVKVEDEEKENSEAEQREHNNSEIDLAEFSRKLSVTTTAPSEEDDDDEDDDEDDDVVVLGSSGPAALRDFPHPRPLCANFPFGTTPHEKYCSQCYCVTCEVVAPCSNWEGSDAHCNIISKQSREKLDTGNPVERKLFSL